MLETLLQILGRKMHLPGTLAIAVAIELLTLILKFIYIYIYIYNQLFLSCLYLILNAGERTENFRKNTDWIFLSPVERSLKKFLGLCGRGIENSRTREAGNWKNLLLGSFSFESVLFLLGWRSAGQYLLHDMMILFCTALC